MEGEEKEEVKIKDSRSLANKIKQSIKDTEYKKESVSEQFEQNKMIFGAALAAAFMLSFTVFATYNSFLSTKLTRQQVPPRLEQNQKALGSCVIGGCNSEICAEEEMASACLYLEKFACYKTATCEVQENGECGWTFDEELTSCLESFVPEPSI